MMAALVVLLLAPSPLDDRFVSFGANVGSHLLDGPAQLKVGWEISLVWTDLGREWQGIYADVLLIPDRDFIQGSFGAEIGWAFLGLDAGPVGLLEGDRFSYGGRLRAIGTLGVGAAYAGFGVLGGRGGFGEIGLLIKIPIRLSR
jgi:hypothetical protein